jgi:hypothetical protein
VLYYSITYGLGSDILNFIHPNILADLQLKNQTIISNKVALYLSYALKNVFFDRRLKYTDQMISLTKIESFLLLCQRKE